MIPELLISFVTMIFLSVKAISIDKFSIIFSLIPIFSTYYIGKKMNCLKYDAYQEGIIYERQKGYVLRTVYLQDYAKEIRLSNIFYVLMKYFNDAMKELLSIIKKYGLKIEFFAEVQSFFTQIVIYAGSYIYAAIRLLYFKDITTGEFIVLVNIINNRIY